MTVSKHPIGRGALLLLLSFACLLCSCSESSPRKDTLQARQIRQLSQMAENGDKDARFILGYFYVTGEGILRDVNAARSTIESSAKDWHPSARDFSTVFRTNLRDGKEIPPDKIVEWVRESSAYGDGCAQYIQGTWFAFGKGVPQDLSTATKWLESASSRGIKIANWLLRELPNP